VSPASLDRPRLTHGTTIANKRKKRAGLFLPGPLCIQHLNLSLGGQRLAGCCNQAIALIKFQLLTGGLTARMDLNIQTQGMASSLMRSIF
jgi:hypothetical protein